MNDVSIAERRIKAPFFPVQFDVDDANRCGKEWGANCGPGAVAAVTGKTLDDIRPCLHEFEQKRYTNPTLMWKILDGLGIRWERTAKTWPWYGLARIQWGGPWTKPGVPARVAYRHTHWVGVHTVWVNGRSILGAPTQIFDINCICVGGWVTYAEWSAHVVPWLLKQCEPKADGTFWVTHAAEVLVCRDDDPCAYQFLGESDV